MFCRSHDHFFGMLFLHHHDLTLPFSSPPPHQPHEELSHFTAYLLVSCYYLNSILYQSLVIVTMADKTEDLAQVSLPLPLILFGCQHAASTYRAMIFPTLPCILATTVQLKHSC